MIYGSGMLSVVVFTLHQTHFFSPRLVSRDPGLPGFLMVNRCCQHCLRCDKHTCWKPVEGTQHQCQLAVLRDASGPSGSARQPDSAPHSAARSFLQKKKEKRSSSLVLQTRVFCYVCCRLFCNKNNDTLMMQCSVYMLECFVRNRLFWESKCVICIS